MSRFVVRMRPGAPMTVLVIVVFVGFLVPAKFAVDAPAVPKATLAAAAACWLVVGLALRARAWRVVDTPVSKVRAATVGECEFAGIAQSPTPRTAPGSGIPCAWFRWELQERVRSGKSTRWVRREQLVHDQPFWLTDDTGSIWVVPQNADFEGIEQHVMGVPGRNGRWRQVEWRLPDHGNVYVLGPVRAAGDALLVGCPPDSDDDYLISDDSKRTVARRLGGWAWGSLLLGGIAALLTPVVETTSTTSETGTTSVWFALHGSLSIVAAVLGAYLAMLAVTWLVRIYNRLVTVRFQAEKAWSSIEVQLQRRRDLIENLTVVVQRYAQYEHDTLVATAAARSSAALPTDAQLQQAMEVDGATRNIASRLIALGESYPALHADEQFAKLSATLVDTENRIAFARQFYNDAVTVLRDRRHTLPYSLIARFVPVPTFALFGELAPVGLPVIAG